MGNIEWDMDRGYSSDGTKQPTHGRTREDHFMMSRELLRIYDAEAVRPMREELEFVGVRSLRTAADVDETLDRKGLVLLVVNSVCRCASECARPGLVRALANAIVPDHLCAVFAGVDRDAVSQARSYMSGIPPSSPSIALFRDRKPLYVLERRHIEQLGANGVAHALVDAFNRHCAANVSPTAPPDDSKQPPEPLWDRDFPK